MDLSQVDKNGNQRYWFVNSNGFYFGIRMRSQTNQEYFSPEDLLDSTKYGYIQSSLPKEYQLADILDILVTKLKQTKVHSPYKKLIKNLEEKAFQLRLPSQKTQRQRLAAHIKHEKEVKPKGYFLPQVLKDKTNMAENLKEIINESEWFNMNLRKFTLQQKTSYQYRVNDKRISEIAILEFEKYMSPVKLATYGLIFQFIENDIWLDNHDTESEILKRIKALVRSEQLTAYHAQIKQMTLKSVSSRVNFAYFEEFYTRTLAQLDTAYKQNTRSKDTGYFKNKVKVKKDSWPQLNTTTSEYIHRFTYAGLVSHYVFRNGTKHYWIGVS